MTFPSDRFVRAPVALGCFLAALAADGWFVEAQEQTFGEEIAVRMVEVDVRVHDRHGVSIDDLEADDFALFVDGRPVEIDFFSVGSSTHGKEGGPVDSESEEPALAATAQATTALPTVAIYLDQTTLHPADGSRALEALSDLAISLDGRVATTLMTFDGSLAIPVRSTTSHQQLVDALEASLRRLTSGLVNWSAEARAVERINSKYGASGRSDEDKGCGGRSSDGLWNELLQDWRIYSEEQASSARGAIDGLLEAIRTVGALPGRKSLIFVSSGLTRIPGITVNEYIAQLCPNEQDLVRRVANEYDLSATLARVTAYANMRRVTLHTLDAGGLRPLAAATVQGESSVGRFSAHTSQVRTSNLQSGLFTLARDTGGEAVLNDNRPVGALAQIDLEQRAGYILGFLRDQVPDDRLHRIRVRLKHKGRGTRVDYRRSFVDARPEDLLVDRLLAALQLGKEVNPLGIGLSLESASSYEAELVEVSVHVTVPVASVIKGLEPSSSEMEMRVLAVAMDSSGRRTLVRQSRIPVLDASGEDSFEIRMKLPPVESWGHRSGE